MGQNCCAPPNSGVIQDIPKKRKSIVDKEDEEKQEQDLHIVEESIVGVEGDMRKPKEGEKGITDDPEKHATKSYLSEPIQWEIEKEGQREGSIQPTVNKEGSNPTPTEADLKVKEGTEVQFTEASLKVPTIVNVEQASKGSIEPQTEASEIPTKKTDGLKSDSMSEEEKDEFPEVQETTPDLKSSRIIRFACKNLAKGDEIDRTISEVLNKFCELKPRNLNTMSLTEPCEETNGMTEAEKMQRALALAKDLLP